MVKFEYLSATITLILLFPLTVKTGNLFPKTTKTRELISLDGIWKFSFTNISGNAATLTGLDNDKDLFFMPVPASYNDILTTREGKDFIGEAKYERQFTVPSEWINNFTRVWLRFGSVCTGSHVYVNGEFTATHPFGHLPFKSEITSLLVNDENNITVFADSTLNETTIPQAVPVISPEGKLKLFYRFDFFNYAGIDRPVIIYTTPKVYIEDIYVTSIVAGKDATVKFNVTTGGLTEGDSNLKYTVTVLDKERKPVATHTGPLTSNDGVYSDSLDISNAKLWWPYLMSDDPGYQYTLKVELKQEDLIDHYEQLFGIRQLAWNNTFLINGKRVYIRSVGRHEDSLIGARGLDYPTIIRDHNLLRWLGVNGYRTSHYPYAEEIMDLADSLGIMIIDEAPAVNAQFYSNELLANHKLSLSELYERDKNRPSVIMWSVSNEPNVTAGLSVNYFKDVLSHMKFLDRTRPVTLVNRFKAEEAVNVFQYMDIISYNRYLGWYDYSGTPQALKPELLKEVTAFYDTYKKPVLLTEYGGGTLEGSHALPAAMWSEEYQQEIMSNNFKGFDELMKNEWFIGESLWNFADYRVPDRVDRTGFNRKGIFTRARQPKASAFLLRRRYWALSQYNDNSTAPDDLDRYVFNDNSPYYKDEL